MLAPAPRSPVASAPPDWTVTHQAVAVAVADAVGVPVPSHWSRAHPRVDWTRFAALVSAHAVAPLARRSGWLAAQPVPSAVDSRLHVLARRATAAGLRTLAALGEIEVAADGLDLDLVVLEGPALASWAYGDPLARHCGHLRLLVDPKAVARAMRLLTGLGFEIIGPTDGAGTDAAVGDAEVTFVRGATFVDLRWRLFGNAALLPLDWSDPRNRLRVDAGGLTVTTMARELAWWYLAAHGTQLRWSSLRWLADVPAVLHACPGLAAPDALARAEEVGVDICVATALRLAGDVLGMPLAPDAAAWVASRPVTERLAQQSRRYLAATVEPGNGTAPARAYERASFVLGMRRDARYRRATVRQAVLQGAHDRIAPLLDRLAHRPSWRGLVVRTTRALLRASSTA